MKKALIKIPAMLAMAVTLFSFYVYFESIIKANFEIWIFSAMLAMFSMPFYFIDAVISFVKAIKKRDAKFNFTLTAILIVAIPLLLFFGGSGNDFYNIIWNVYYLLIFVLEIISIKRCIKA